MLASQQECHYTHIILDEVHERSIEIDFAMLIAREIASKHPDLKVVLMSATLQSHLFVKYFRHVLGESRVADPYFVGIKIFPVHEFFIDELEKLVSDREDEDQADAMKELSLLHSQREKNPSVLAHAAEVTDFAQNVAINLIISQPSPGDAILVFLPGYSDILEFHSKLRQKLRRLDIIGRFNIFPFHHKVPISEVEEAFKKPLDGTGNVILSTSMAESSLTFPYLKFVINFGIMRHMIYDTSKGVSTLTRQWCSRASCTQRKGRVGRVSEGTAIHLITRGFYEDLPDFNPPEILIEPLSKTLLKAKLVGKKCNMSSPSQLLSAMIQPPSLLQYEAALHDLAKIGAIVHDPQSSTISEEGEITLLGRFSLKLPLDINLCRLILLGILFGCPLDAVVIAANLFMYKNIFSFPTRLVMDINKFCNSLARTMFSRLKFDAGCYSTSIMVCNVFIEWLKFRQQNRYLNRRELARQFCWKHGLIHTRLLNFEASVAEISQALADCVPQNSQLHVELKTLANIERSGMGEPVFCDTDFFYNNTTSSTSPKPNVYMPPHLRNVATTRRRTVSTTGKQSRKLHFCNSNLILKALMSLR